MGLSPGARCFFLVLALAPGPAGAWQCPRIPLSSTRNFSVTYPLPGLDAGSPVQNVAVFTDPTGAAAVFVAVRNRILVASAELQLLSVLVTGPVGSARCEICSLCPAADAPGLADTDNVILQLDPLEPWLYSCGTAQHGLCYQHELEVRDGEVAIAATRCLYSAGRNGPAGCPDCVASPLGTSATVVADRYASFFYLASTINSSVAARYSPQSVSIRRLKATLDGFADGHHSLTVRPPYQDSYPIHYVHSFSDGDYVYFLTVQRESPLARSYHTRLARLSTQEQDLRRYRELVLDCRYESKRRRRRRDAEAGAERDVAYNVLQAAHAARPGARLARDLSINATELVLFGAFAESRAESRAPRDYSAVCAFPLRLLNRAIEDGMDKCCGLSARPLLRGLSFYQPEEYCPHNVSLGVPAVNLSAPVVDTSCWEQPTLVPATSHKVDLFNGRLAGVLLTSIFVTALGNVTVAHLGTAEGRVLQVMVLQRSSSFVVTLANFSLGERQPVQRAVGLQGHSLLFASGNEVRRVNVTGPGCRHFSTCQRCLRAERFMGCGWCGAACARREECAGRWIQDRCPPVLTDFHPRSAPPRGRTRLTLCGTTFRSRLDPDAAASPAGTYRVTVGRRPCQVLPDESGSYRLLPPSRRKDFVEVLVCVLQPGGEAPAGPARVLLSVEEPAGPTGFRVSGSAALDGFTFVVPNVSSVHPPFGPRGGGTAVTLRGANLTAGSSWRVTLNGTECPLAEDPRYCHVATGQRVPGLPRGQRLGTPSPFQYRPDPSVLAIAPNCSYEGSTLTLFGEHLDSVYRAKIRFEASGVKTEAQVRAGTSRHPVGTQAALMARRSPGRSVAIHVSSGQFGLDALATCMNISMTVGGRDCHPNVLKNEVTCRLPRELRLPPDGAPVQVGARLPQGLPSCPMPALGHVEVWDDGAPGTTVPGSLLSLGSQCPCHGITAPLGFGAHRTAMLMRLQRCRHHGAQHME
uniref:Sema domain-containing protein n=1 Tax=Nothoprocta perdicaria TaxID=30464 RepID=A0A8C6ZQY1_NOTPE